VRDNSRRKIPATLRTFLLVACGLALTAGLLLLLIPTLDGEHSRLYKNESVAVSTLRTIVTLQNEYATAHAYGGFACELSLLKSIGQQNFPDYSLEFLLTGVQSGYRFSLVSCSPDANRGRVYYQVTAVPLEPPKTGVRAFCADDTGSLWYDLGGSGTNCLAFRRMLE